MILDHCHRASCKQIIDALKSDLDEQCRLLSMSAERECALRGRLEQAIRELERVQAIMLREAGIGVVNVNVIQSLRAAIGEKE